MYIATIFDVKSNSKLIKKIDVLHQSKRHSKKESEFVDEKK